jgi:hypothetical protein
MKQFKLRGKSQADKVQTDDPQNVQENERRKPKNQTDRSPPPRRWERDGRSGKQNIDSMASQLSPKSSDTRPMMCVPST